MDNLIVFPDRKKQETNWESPEIIGVTKEEWDVMDPNGVLKEEESFWRCLCGEVLYFLTPDGVKCKNCGVFCSGWTE